MSEWRKLSLRQAGVTLIDCDHRTPLSVDTGYPYVAIPQVKNGRIDIDAARRISPENFVEWTRKTNPAPYDVVLSRRCNPGETAFVAPEMRFALGQNLVLLRADGHSIYPPFLRWLVRGQEWWNQVGQFINVGAVFESLKCADIPKFELLIPPLKEQHAIAHILGTLDDKIELNRRMNDTLEAMARTIFKSWFVDFDPVRAKASGEPPESICRRLGLTPDVLALFPDSFQDSELGEIPESWSASTIGALADIVGGGTPNTKEPDYWTDGQHYWATPKDLSKLSTPVLLGTERKVTDKGLGQIGSGLLPRGTVLLSSRAPIGYRAIAEVPVAVNQGFIAMLPRAGVSRYFLLYWAEWAHDEIVSRANGSTFLEISKGSFRPIPVAIPPQNIFAAFDTVIGPIYERMVSSERESVLLTDERDTLLPQLLSGNVMAPAMEMSA